jgi:hypothetical protein
MWRNRGERFDDVRAGGREPGPLIGGDLRDAASARPVLFF